MWIKDILNIAINDSEKNYYISQNFINNETLTFIEKIDWIIWLKNNLIRELKNTWNLDEIKDNFYVDGSILINEYELSNIKNKEALSDLIKKFWYKKWNKYIFRNRFYYFLFDSLKVSWINKFGSINDFRLYVISQKNNNWSNKVYNKILLWLIDAKINILAFLENISNIITDENFLNPDYLGSLIFSQEDVKDIKMFYENKGPRKSKKNFNFLKESLINLNDYEMGNKLVWELQKNGECYIKLLFWDEMAFDELQNITFDEKFNEKFFYILNEKIKLLFEIVKSYSTINNKIGLYQDFINKLVRLYREENDPLIILKTALNAFTYVLENWFNIKKDCLDIFSVNYWWSIIGVYVKPLFNKLFNNFWVWIENWNIVYSKYDLKNTNKLLKFSEYPKSTHIKKIISHTKMMVSSILDYDIKKYQKLKNIAFDYKDWKNWALIFDDNAQSWTTLRELKTLLLKEDTYDNVETFVCRINPKLNGLSQKYTWEEKLLLLSWAWTLSRRSPLKFLAWSRYNESISRIIWRQIYKEISY